MPDESHRDYFLRRAKVQEAVAATAATPDVAAIHHRLVALYRDAAARPSGIAGSPSRDGGS